MNRRNSRCAEWRFTFRLLSILSLWFVLVGCAKIPGSEDMVSPDCLELWQVMDDAISRADVGGGATSHIDGFAYLRTDRFVTALGSQADSTLKERALIEQMRVLDLERRYLELEFLPDDDWQALTRHGYPVDEGLFKRQVARCSVEFMKADRVDPDYFESVMAAIDVDQDYSTLYRTLGLYPLTQLIVSHQVEQYQETHSVVVGAEVAGAYRRFSPPSGRKLSLKRRRLLLKNNRVTPFLNFQFSEQDLSDLVRLYAPVFQIGGDSFGRIMTSGKGEWQVDTADPVVYYYLSQAIVQGIPALQINYVIWFAKRGDPAPWYTKGHLDGITLRLTLDWQGRPLIFDSIGNCGCFYFGLHNDELVELGSVQDGFVPHFVGVLPSLADSNHLSVQVASGANNVIGVSTTKVRKDEATYTLLPYEILERYGSMLPRKFFDEQGFVDGTDRFESYFLFPMGIPNVGAMRQRGRQPITLIGRAYFDDPHLFNSVLQVKEPLPAKNKLVKKGKKKQSNLKRRVEASKTMGQTGRSYNERYPSRRGR